MADKMSQEEIDMLINGLDANDMAQSANNALTEAIASGAISVNSLYKPIDFRKPNKLQYDNLGALKQIHEQFAKLLNNYLTALLRIGIQVVVDFEYIEQLSFQQYCNIVRKNCIWNVFSTSPTVEDEGRCFIQMDSSFCNFIIDRSFGRIANYEPTEEDEDVFIADMSKEILKVPFGNILNLYQQSWRATNVTSYDMEMSSIEDNVQNLNLGAGSSEMMLIIPMDISIFQKVGDGDDSEVQRSCLKVCIPYRVIEPVLDRLNISTMLSSQKSETENLEIKTRIQKMSNSVDVYVGETNVTFSELLSLDCGDIVGFGKKQSEPYDVYVGGLKKYKADAYQLQGSVCMKIVDK